MCGAARYFDPSRPKPYSVGYGFPDAALPVLREQGRIEWVKWGRRQGQDVPGLPVTGWARLATIEAGGWDKYEPEFVQLAIQQFGEKDAEGKRYWFKLQADEHIQALIAHSREHGTERLYVVTVETPSEFAWIHDRWPRILSEKDRADHSNVPRAPLQ